MPYAASPTEAGSRRMPIDDDALEAIPPPSRQDRVLPAAPGPTAQR
jgi:hypothetical protein